MSEQMRISAKKLGALAMPTFCPRCFWTVMRLRGKFPYFTFPSIFGKIDVFTKDGMCSFFVREGRPPKCLHELGKIVEYIEPPTHHTFRLLTRQNILLTGSADAMFRLEDQSLLICDYKTAEARGEEDPLYEIYAVQLNAYALLAQKLGMGKVSKLALLYTTPQLSQLDAARSFSAAEDSINMSFKFHAHEIPLDLSLLDVLLDRARKVFDMEQRPLGRKGCRDCDAVENFYELLKGCDNSVQAYALI